MKRFGAAFFFVCFVWMMVMCLSSGVTAAAWSGSGSKSNPYQIGDVAGLAALAAGVGEGNAYTGTYFILTADLDLGAAYGENGSIGQGWTPIGSCQTSLGDATFFEGHFLGDHHRIDGLYVQDQSYGGLFGLCKDGSLEDLTVAGAISGATVSGGLAAYASHVTITGCASTVTIRGAGDSGGIVGHSEFGRFYADSYRGELIGGGNAGGIVGLSQNDRLIKGCQAAGTVRGNAHSGGIVGSCLLNDTAAADLSIDGCVNRAGLTSAGSDLGGIVGLLENRSKQGTKEYSGAVINCVNLADLACGGDHAGGILGAVAGYDVWIANNCNAGAVRGSGSAYGGIAGSLAQSDVNVALVVNNCVNNGAVGGSADRGGVAGKISGKTDVGYDYWGQDCTLTDAVGTKEGSGASVTYNRQYGVTPLFTSHDAVSAVNAWVTVKNGMSDCYQRWIDLKLELTNVVSDTKAGVQLVSGAVGLTALNPLTVKVKLDNADKTSSTYSGGGESEAPYHGSVALTKKGETWRITASAAMAAFDVSHDLTRLSATAGSAGEDKAAFAQDYTTTLTPDSDHLLPDAVSVSIGHDPAPREAYDYDSGSGVLVIHGAYITGDIAIRAVSYLGYWYLLGEKNGLPEGDEVIYGSLSRLQGTDTLQSDASFAALTPGGDYTWWITYDAAAATWLLHLDHFVMTQAYAGGDVIACYEQRPFAVSAADTTLLGAKAESALVYSGGDQALTLTDATLTQSGAGGIIAAGDGDLTATVTNSGLSAENNGGRIFVINAKHSADSLLTAILTGENSVAADGALLSYGEENGNSGAILRVDHDFSFTAAHGAAAESGGDIDIITADKVKLCLRAGDRESDADAVRSQSGDITLSGGELMFGGTGNSVAAETGDITISDCTMEATGGQGYGAFFAGNQLALNHVGVIAPAGGNVETLTTTMYYGDNDNDDTVDGGEVRYAKYTDPGQGEVYYDCLNKAALTKADFDSASAAPGIKAAPALTGDTVALGHSAAAYVQLGVTYGAQGYFVKSGADYNGLTATAEVPFGSTEAAAKAALPGAAYVKLLSVAGDTVYAPVSLDWSLKDYDNAVPAAYDAVAAVSYSESGADYPGATDLTAASGSVRVLERTYRGQGYFIKEGNDYSALTAAAEVAYGTPEAAAKAALPGAAYVKLLSNDNAVVYVPVSLNWSIEKYDDKTAAVYNALATVVYADSNAHYPGVGDLSAVSGKVTVLAADHKCAAYSDRAAWPDWAKDSICFVIENQLMVGMSAEPLTFNPAPGMSRAMVVQILYNLSGKPALSAGDLDAYNGKFSDVTPADWYYEAIVWAAGRDIAKGVGDNRFAPNAEVTREQMVTFLWRFEGSPAADGNLNAFPDAAKVSAYAQTAFAWAVAEDIVNGMAYGSAALLSPATTCTRGQVAVMVAQYAKNCLNQRSWIDLSSQ